jgi:hypothetical protein
MFIPGAPLPKLPISSFHRHLAIEVARHEVGHYIVGRALGLSMGEISIRLLDLNGSHRGTVSISPEEELSTNDDLVDWLQRRIKQLYAGVWAQSLGKDSMVNAERATTFAKNGGQDDYSKAQMLIHIIRNIRFKKPSAQSELTTQLEDIHHPLWDDTAALVQAEADLIIGLSDMIGSRLHHTNETCLLTEDELLAIPSIRARFPSLSESIPIESVAD